MALIVKPISGVQNGGSKINGWHHCDSAHLYVRSVVLSKVNNQHLAAELSRPVFHSMIRSSFCLHLKCRISSHSSGIVRASSLFPILSTILLMLGGLCVGVGRIYSTKNNILLSGGILFVAAGRYSSVHPTSLSSIHPSISNWCSIKYQDNAHTTKCHLPLVSFLLRFTLFLWRYANFSCFSDRCSFSLKDTGNTLQTPFPPF